MLFVSFVVLQACQTAEPEQEMIGLFEQIAKLEENMSDANESLIRLEERQTDLYEQMMSLGLKRFDEVSKLAKEAQAVVEQRQKYLEDEHAQTGRAKKLLSPLNRYVEQLPDEAIKARARRLIETMEQRYAQYETVYAHYQKALALEKQLYRLFLQPNVTLEELQKQVEEMNQAYSEMVAANERLNGSTAQYNEAKKQLHKMLQQLSK